MCGILGVRRSFLDDPQRFDAAVRAMEWRGPDGTGRHTTEHWQLATARLAISGEEGQPLARDGRVIAFNGAVTSAEDERMMLGVDAPNDAELPLIRLARNGDTGLLTTRGRVGVEGRIPLSGSRLPTITSTIPARCW